MKSPSSFDVQCFQVQVQGMELGESWLFQSDT